MNYAYTNIKNLTIKNIVILGKFFKKLFFRNKKIKNKYPKKPKPVPGGCTVRAPSPSAFVFAHPVLHYFL